MGVTQGPGKFYGSSLSRPQIYTDIKFNDERVDSPSSVTDPLMTWAEEAHWSMGELSFKRLRLQGCIEGNVTKLRAQCKKFLKNQSQFSANLIADLSSNSNDDENNKDSSPSPPPAPMATKRRRRFTAVIEEENDREDVDLELKNLKEGKNGAGGDEVGVRKGRTLARKLGDDFDRVEMKSGLGKSKGSSVKSLSNGLEMVALQTRSQRTEESDGGDEVVKVVEDVKKTNSKGNKMKRIGEKAKSVVESGSSTPAGKTRTSPRLEMR